MSDATHRTGKKNRKHKRSFRCAADENYRQEKRWVTNKMRKLKRHIHKKTADKIAVECLNRLIKENPLRTKQLGLNNQ